MASHTSGLRRRQTQEGDQPADPKRNNRRKDSKWEILASLEPGVTYNNRPKRLEGYFSKRRKWPMKGWHKRFFVLENGVLKYGKTKEDMRRGRTIGCIDVGTSVISAKTEMLRIDIDDEECIHHIKASDIDVFTLWMDQLKQHRFHQQSLLNTLPHQPHMAADEATATFGSPSKMAKGFVLSPRNSLPRGGAAGGGQGMGTSGRSLVQEFTTLDDRVTQKLLEIQQQAVGVGLIAQKLEDEQNNCLSQQGSSSATAGKPKHFFGLRKKKSMSTSGSVSGGSFNNHTNTMSTNYSSRSSTLTSMTSMVSGAADTLSSVQLRMQQPQVNLPSTTESVDTNVDLLSIGTNCATVTGLSNSNPSLSSSSGNSGSRPNSMPVGPPENNKPLLTKLPSPGGLVAPSLVVPEFSPALSACVDELVAAAQDLQAEVANLVRSYTADRDRFKATLQDSQEFMAYMMGHNGTVGTAAGGFGVGRNTTIGGGGTFGPLPGTNTIGLGTLGASGPQSLMMANLRHALTVAMQQNSLMRAKLQRIHADSELGDLPTVNAPTVETLPRAINQSLSYSSSCISGSEFFDAQEYNTDADATDETSEEEEEEMEDAEDRTSVDSDDDDKDFQDPAGTMDDHKQDLLSKSPTMAATDMENGVLQLSAWNTGRRNKLPAMEADTSGVNLWNLLCRNIGKDLSKISMPVTLNEPLSVLQRLCEELEYSDLLDKAVMATERADRMSLIAAFVVSNYASCNARAGHKPFNPLLGETYECIRDDRGFRFVSEQVSHHPPVSACHATGKNWNWWQDFRVKTKFWGKSMEFQPEGFVYIELRLPDGSKETYRFNKITTCIHNLFSMSDRWADLYGECIIDCHATPSNGADSENVMTCKLEFLKSASGYWSSGKRHEVQGTIFDNQTGKVVQSVFGKCTEAFYCGKAASARCIWRPGALPDDHAYYYGFSRFAIELNELLATEKDFLPITDTRFRPDQRYLEEGLISDAETTKLGLEQAQRERRAEMAENSEHHESLWFEKSETDTQWFFKNTYWKCRQSPGFAKMNNIPRLW